MDKSQRPAKGRATAEERRLEEARTRAAHWRRWGPYLAERQWGNFYVDSTPIHSYMRALYRYPQGTLPYAAAGSSSSRLITTSARRPSSSSGAWPRLHQATR
jgi:hypothetical protein